MQIERGVMDITALGPGKRFAVWVNGCKRRCPGCISQRLQAEAPQNECDLEEFLRDFPLSRADGATVSGGEPFDQPAELNKLTRLLNERGVDDILVYTGYTLEQLRARADTDTEAALSRIAVLVDGPYIREQDDGKNNLKGSANQRVLFLKPGFEEKYAAYLREERAMQEVAMEDTLLAAGIPPAGFAEKFSCGEEKTDKE